MGAQTHQLQELLVEIIDLGTVAEDQGINKITPCDPLIERAQSLGVPIEAPMTLGELRDIIEHACSAPDTSAIMKSRSIA